MLASINSADDLKACATIIMIAPDMPVLVQVIIAASIIPIWPTEE